MSKTHELWFQLQLTETYTVLHKDEGDLRSNPEEISVTVEHLLPGNPATVKFNLAMRRVNKNKKSSFSIKQYGIERVK